MDGPPPGMAGFNGAGNGDDDEYPNDLGTSYVGANYQGDGAGDFAQPSLDWLASEMSRIHVSVARIEEFVDDFSDEASFVKNLDTASFHEPGQSVRDVSTDPDLWVIQVFAAYEGPITLDFDTPPLQEDPEDYQLSYTDYALDRPINIYLETIRDVSANLIGAVDPQTLAARMVLHETVHRFGHVLHDSDVMITRPNNVLGDDENNQLSGVQCEESLCRLVQRRVEANHV